MCCSYTIASPVAQPLVTTTFFFQVPPSASHAATFMLISPSVGILANRALNRALRPYYGSTLVGNVTRDMTNMLTCNILPLNVQMCARQLHIKLCNTESACATCMSDAYILEMDGLKIKASATLVRVGS